MLQRLIEFLRGDLFRQALRQQEQVRNVHQAALLRNARGFAQAMERIRGRSLTLGTYTGAGKDVLIRVPLQDFCTHHLIQGRSGSGKSRFAESLILQLLQSFPEVGLVVIDGKGELFARVRLWIAALLYNMNERQREHLLQRVLIVDPFHTAVIPPLNFCTASAGAPAELLAEDILGGLRRLFAGDGITLRMEVLLRNLLVVLIEAGRGGPPLSLLEARAVLLDEPFRARALSRVKNEEAHAYFAQDFPRESRSTIEAVKSRLSSLLMSEQVRLSFGAAECLQLRDAIAQGKIVLINLGKNLLATDTAREVIGTLLLSHFIRAVFSRPMNKGPYILSFLDEFQNFVLADVFEKLYAEARAYRCFLTAICQQMSAQVASRSLRDIILNNCRHISVFSSTEEDARLLGRVMFRPTGYLPKPRDLFVRDQAPRFYTEGEELEQFIRRIPSLKTRHCYFWDKESPFGAQLLVTNKVPDPHEVAGLPEEQFLRFVEELEPLWKRMGRKREETKNIIAARRNQWGIESNAPQPPHRAQNRKALLTKLKAHFGTDASEEE